MTIESSTQVTTEEEKPKRTRRSSAEVQAEREAKAALKLAGTTPPPLPEPKRMSPLEAVSILAINNINPSAYSDIYTLMKDCIAFRRQYNLNGNQFVELMDKFDDRVVDVKDDKENKRRR